MLVPHPTKLLALCSLILTATAFPAPFSNLDATVAAHCQLSCQLTYSKCFARSGNSNSNFCRNLVNDSYDDKCTGCDYALAFVADIQPTSNSHELSARDVANEAAMNAASTKCIIICGHGWCRPLCAITGPPPSGSTDNTVDASTSSSMTDLVASTNAQPGQIGIPLSPDTATIVLGQKDEDGKTEKCAWICSSKTQACQETCWATGDIQGARVTDGGYLAVDQAVEGAVGCDVMDKDEIGPLIVCVVPTIESGGSIGAGDIDWNQMRCVLFWQDRKPHIVCRHV